MTEQKILRCAVYTRKSNENGLEQDFNSIHAQKEACHAYITAKRGQGWRAVDTDYDDQAFSGGTMERPALQQLLTDIQAGLIDVVVFYKMDRLTRSVPDYSSLMKTFDAYDISFASVTEEYNTTNSSGRLALNMSMSFAQYEREITAERIRDKVAASKRKGLWMGGIPPLGYDVKDRALIINEKEAQTVRSIFRRFIEVQSTTKLAKELQLEGIETKSWTTQKGIYRPGKLISKAYLYKLFHNRLYLGEISHKENWYPAIHEPIINQPTWDAVHAIFKVNRRDRAAKTRSDIPFLLKGLLFDLDGYALTSWGSSCRKSGKRYRYYVSSKDNKGYEGESKLPRFEANQLEYIIVSHFLHYLRSPAIIDAMTEQSDGIDEAQITIAMIQIEKIWDMLFPDEQARIIHLVIEKILVSQHCFEVIFKHDGISAMVSDITQRTPKRATQPETQSLSERSKLDIDQCRVVHDSAGRLTLIIPYKLRRQGEKKVLLSANKLHANDGKITPLQIALARGFEWEAMLFNGEVDSLKALAKKVGVGNSYVSRMVNLTTLAPDIIQAILDDTLPDSVRLEDLAIGTPMLWEEQREKVALQTQSVT